MRKQVFALLGPLLAAIVVLPLTGCGCSGTAGVSSTSSDASTTTSISAAAETGEDGAVILTQGGLSAAKDALAGLFDLTMDEIGISARVPASAGADTVLVWAAGQADVDGVSGRIYSVAVDRPFVDTRWPALADVRLRYLAGRMPAQLGWGEDMLAGLGFRQEQPGALLADQDIYVLTWAQYDGAGSPADGVAEVQLDSRTGDLVGFTMFLGSEAPDISGALSAAEAMAIAETHIFLETDDLKIPLTDDGSLVLLGKSLSQELKTLEDGKITRGKPLLTWVISLTGTVDGKTVGGTVYIDATTGRVLAYERLADE